MHAKGDIEFPTIEFPKLSQENDEEDIEEEENPFRKSHAVPLNGKLARFLLDLMDLARDHRTTTAEFLAKARENPSALSITDSFNKSKNNAQPNSSYDSLRVGGGGSSFGASDSFDSDYDEAVSRRITPKVGDVLRAAHAKAKAAAAVFHHANDSKETHLNPLHIFLGHAKDISARFIEEIDKLDGACLTRVSSLNRTPVHHFMERNQFIDPNCLVAYYRADPNAFIRYDIHRHTPLDRYFKHNFNSSFNPMSDRIVHRMCASFGHWGLDALSKSTEAYRNRTHQKTRSQSFAGGYGGDNGDNDNGNGETGELPPEFKVLTNGDPYQVEAFIGSMMRDGSAEDTFANLKFLFVVVPLRAPTKYGLSSTMGLQLVSRVFTTTADVYAGELGEANLATKQWWMKAFTDAAIHMIHDEGLLKGMLTDSPSKEAIEAIASTEFMSRVLKFKFLSGTSLIFFFEFLLFILLFALVVTSILSHNDDITVVIIGLVFTIYFTTRELHHMYELRNQELAFDSDDHQKLRKIGHIYTRTFRPSLPGLPQGAGSRGSILSSTTVGETDDEKNYGGDGGSGFHESDQESDDEEDDELTNMARQRHQVGDQKLLNSSSPTSSNPGTPKLPIPPMIGSNHSSSSSSSSSSHTGSHSIHEVVNRLRSASHCQALKQKEKDLSIEKKEEEARILASHPNAKKFGLRKNTVSMDDLEFKDHIHEYEEKHSQRSKRKAVMEDVSKWITLHLGIAVAWRNNAFNWVNFCSLLGCWITLLHRLLVDLKMANGQDKIMKSANVITVVFLWLRFLGFLRGTNIKMATFILMLQEISVNVDTFLVVLALILVMFAMLYHILLVDNNSLDDDEWTSFDTSLWKVWGFAIGEVDESAFPTESSYFLFTAFGLTIVIIMMNILIAIVSDSYTDAVNRSAPLFWRARVELIAEYEPLLPKLYDDDVVALMDEKILRDIAKKGGTPPNTCQYHCLMWQEGLIATSIVCGLVLFELLYINDSSTNDDDSYYDEDFYLALGVTCFFLFEILLRFYVWKDTVRRMGSTSAHAIGGWFSNPFRFIDTVVVIIDVTLFGFEMLASSNGSNNAKASVKLARSLRLVRGARWLRCMKVLRSCRFFAKLVNRIRLYLRPSRKDVEESLMSHYRKLEQSTSWAGRIVDISKKMKHDLNRSTFHILQVFEDYQEEMKNLQAYKMREHSKLIESKVNALQQGLNQVKRKLQVEDDLEPVSVKFGPSPSVPTIPRRNETPHLSNISASEKTKKPARKLSGATTDAAHHSESSDITTTEEGGGGGGVKFTHLDQMMDNVTLRTLKKLRDKEDNVVVSNAVLQESVSEVKELDVTAKLSNEQHTISEEMKVDEAEDVKEGNISEVLSGYEKVNQNELHSPVVIDENIGNDSKVPSTQEMDKVAFSLLPDKPGHEAVL